MAFHRESHLHTCSYPIAKRVPARAAQAGFTIVELLVSISIIGLLVALILPAVQSSRETARRIDCTSRLRQIGIAVESYTTEWRYFPRGVSWKYELLPHLDLRTIYDVGFPEYPDSTRSTFLRRDTTQSLIPAYLCPSDGVDPLVSGSGSANYAACYGSGVLDFGYNGLFNNWIDDPNSTYKYKEQPVRPAHVTDGLSNTALASELLRQNGDINSILRVTFDTPIGYRPGEGNLIAAICEGIPSWTAPDL